MGYLSGLQLRALGFAALGRDVHVSDKASIYNPAGMALGDYVRIDDFCILSAGAGGIALGRNVHIACYTSLIGHAPIVFEDFAGASGRVLVYSSSEDMDGELLTNPTIPEPYRRAHHAAVTIRRHAVIGAGTVILPGVDVGEGAVVAAQSLVVRDCAPFYLYAGSPARRVKPRSRKLLEAEKAYLESDAGEQP